MIKHIDCFWQTASSPLKIPTYSKDLFSGQVQNKNKDSQPQRNNNIN